MSNKYVCLLRLGSIIDSGERSPPQPVGLLSRARMASNGRKKIQSNTGFGKRLYYETRRSCTRVCMYVFRHCSSSDMRRPTQQARYGTENLYLDLFTVDLPYGHCFRSSVPLLNDGVRRYL